jgi:hypothetical protein
MLLSSPSNSGTSTTQISGKNHALDPTNMAAKSVPHLGQSRLLPRPHCSRPPIPFAMLAHRQRERRHRGVARVIPAVVAPDHHDPFIPSPFWRSVPTHCLPGRCGLPTTESVSLRAQPNRNRQRSCARRAYCRAIIAPIQQRNKHHDRQSIRKLSTSTAWRHGPRKQRPGTNHHSIAVRTSRSVLSSRQGGGSIPLAL